MTELVLYNGNWYHPNFFRRGPLCIKRARHTCQHCGKKRGGQYTAQTGHMDTVVIQAAHVNHNPWNGRAVLIALCKQCHMRYDAESHTKTKRRKKREAQIEKGQLIGTWYEKPKRKRVA